MFYRLLLALDTLSQGLAKLTPGRRDEFETAEIKKSFEGNKKNPKLQKVVCWFSVLWGGMEMESRGRVRWLDTGHSCTEG